MLKRMKMALTIIVLAIAAASVLGPGCGRVPPAIEEPKSLKLSVETHRTGWERDNCLLCHPAHRIHKRRGIVWEAYDLVYTDGRVKNEGNACCADCHGPNR